MSQPGIPVSGPLASIIKATQRANPCMELDVDVIAVARAAVASTAADWNSGVLTNTAPDSRSGAVRLTEGAAASLFSQTAAATVPHAMRDGSATNRGVEEYTLNFFPSTALTQGVSFALDSLDLYLARSSAPGAVGVTLTDSGKFRFIVGYYDQNWRAIPMGDPIDIAASVLTLAGAVYSLNFRNLGRLFVFAPGPVNTNTGTGWDGAAQRVLNQDSLKVSHIPNMARGLWISVQPLGRGSLGAWIGLVANATAAQFDTTQFWRHAANRETGPYDPTRPPYAGTDVAHNPDDNLTTGAVPGYGAKAVANGSWGIARRIPRAQVGQDNGGTWEQPYHVLRIVTYSPTGSVVKVLDLGATATNDVEVRLDDVQPVGTSIVYKGQGSNTSVAGPWTPVGTPATNNALWARDLSNAAWTKVGALGTAQNAIGVDGSANSATTLTDSNVAARADVFQQRTIANDSNPNTVSWWIAKDAVGSFKRIALTLLNGTTVQRVIYFNSQTGASAIHTSAGIVSHRVVDGASIGFAGWWIVELVAQNNSSGNTALNTDCIPFYSATSGGAEDFTLTGTMVVGLVQIEFNVSAFTANPIFTTVGPVTQPSGIVVDGQVLTTADRYRWYQLAAYLTPGPTGATKYSSPSLQTWQMVERVPIVTWRQLKDIDATVVADPLTGQSSIGELKLPILKSSRRDYRDLASQLGSNYSPSQLEAHVYARNTVSGVRYFLNSFRLEDREPTFDTETMTFVSGFDRLTVKIPAAVETYRYPSSGQVAITNVSNVGTTYTITIGGAPFTPNTLGGYRMHGVTGASAGLDYSIFGAGPSQNTTNTFAVTVSGQAAPSIGDTFEIHSDQTTRTGATYVGQDFATIFSDLLAVQAAVPARYRGRLPAATNRAGSNSLPSDGVKALDTLQNVALHCGGILAWNKGRIDFADIYSKDKVSVFTWTDREIVDLSTPVGADRRMPTIRVKYNYQPDNSKFANQAEYTDFDALNGWARPNLFDVYEVSDGICQWNDVNEAKWLADTLQRAWKTGVRLWKVKTAFMYPWLEQGDGGTIFTDQYSDRRLAFSADGVTDQGTALAGRLSVTCVIVGKNLWGNEFVVAVRGLDAITGPISTTGTIGDTATAARSLQQFRKTSETPTTATFTWINGALVSEVWAAAISFVTPVTGDPWTSVALSVSPLGPGATSFTVNKPVDGSVVYVQVEPRMADLSAGDAWRTELTATRDTVPLAGRARVITTTPTSVLVRYAVADPYPQGANTITITYQDQGSGGVTPASGGTVTPLSTITEAVGSFIDYTITRPAFGAGAGRVTFTATQTSTGRVVHTDAIDIPEVSRDTQSLTPVDQNLFNYNGAGPATNRMWIAWNWVGFNVYKPDGSLIAAPATSALPVPPAPTLSQVAGGALGARTLFARIGYIKNNMIFRVGPEASLAVLAGNLLKITSPPAVAGYTGWIPLVGSAANGEFIQLPLGFGSGLGFDYTEATVGFNSTTTSPYDNTWMPGGITAYQLAASLSFYFYPYYDIALGIVVMDGGGGQVNRSPSSSQQQRLDGRVPLSETAITGTTPAGGATSAGTVGVGKFI